MIIGSLGNLIFEVSDEVIKTIRDVSYSGSAQISTHQRHLGKALAEFNGADADSLELKIRLSKDLGSSVSADLLLIAECEKQGLTLPLTIGTTVYGEYRWLIKKHKASLEYFDSAGNVTSADVSLSLVEYLKE